MTGDVEARVVGAFEQAAGLGAQGNGYLQVAKAALQMFGADFVARVGDDERVALGLPIQPFIDGKSQPGALLLLERRALVAWAVGTLRPRTTVVELPLDGTLEVTAANARRGGCPPSSTRSPW